MNVSLVVAAALTVATVGQTASAHPATTHPPVRQDVHAKPWGAGEKKECRTYSTQANLLSCDEQDEDWLLSLYSVIGLSISFHEDKDAAYTAYFKAARDNPQSLLVRYNAPVSPKQKLNVMTNWKCLKMDTVVCRFESKFTNKPN